MHTKCWSGIMKGGDYLRELA